MLEYGGKSDEIHSLWRDVLGQTDWQRSGAQLASLVSISTSEKV